LHRLDGQTFNDRASVWNSNPVATKANITLKTVCNALLQHLHKLLVCCLGYGGH